MSCYCIPDVLRIPDKQTQFFDLFQDQSQVLLLLPFSLYAVCKIQNTIIVQVVGKQANLWRSLGLKKIKKKNYNKLLDK